MSDFLIRAIVAGVGVAAIAGPLGCFVVWRKMAYFGDTLSHGALLGVALGLMLNINLTISIFLISSLMALILFVLKRQSLIGLDSLLGLMSHGALALGLVALSFLTWVRFDMMGLLFGDILAVSNLDIAIIYSAGIAIISVLAIIWRSLFAGTVDYDLAKAEGLKPERSEFIFMLLLACTIAMAMKIVGVLLITALLILPAASARRFARTPPFMALYSAIIGVICVIAGLFGSLQFDTPSGPSIVVVALIMFCVSLTSITKLLTKRTMKGK